MRTLKPKHLKENCPITAISKKKKKKPENLVFLENVVIGLVWVSSRPAKLFFRFLIHPSLRFNHGKIWDDKDTPKNNLFKFMLWAVQLKWHYFLGMIITVACYQIGIRILTEISLFESRHPGSFCSVFPTARPYSHRSFKCQRWVFLCMIKITAPY